MVGRRGGRCGEQKRAQLVQDRDHGVGDSGGDDDGGGDDSHDDNNLTLDLEQI